MVINWQFYSNKKLIDEFKNIACEVNNKNIIVSFDDSRNVINIYDKIYKREKEDYQMIIDFKKKTVSFLLKDIKPLEYDIDCNFKKKDNVIYLTYKIDDEEKKIVIERKDK